MQTVFARSWILALGIGAATLAPAHTSATTATPSPAAPESAAPAPAAPAPAAPAVQSDASQRLSFDVVQGLNINSFLRDGPVAAHLLLRSGLDPRLIVAFPAGNSGVGLWFAHDTRSLTWQLLGRPAPVTLEDSHGRPLYGIQVEVGASGVPALVFAKAVLSSVRVLRNYQADGTFPAELTAQASISGQTITWARDRIDGAAGYRLSIRVLEGTLGPDRITAGSDDQIRLEITAASGEHPLAPLSGANLLNASARQDTAARNALTFLSYHESFLAGSWRFNTYFGRDTLMSVRLLMPALTAEAVNAGLGAVLTRLSPDGEVAHEESVGEFAVLEHLAAGVHSAAPTYDYKMIDGTFMLAPVAAAWLLDDPRGRDEAKAFLAQKDGRSGDLAQTMGADLVSNLRLVLRQAARFAADPRAANLISLKAGWSVGEWRDSNDGLAGGRFPYDVNAVFVPAALDAAHRFFASGMLEPYLADGDRAAFARAADMASVWRAQAKPLFDVSVPNATARAEVSEYAASLKVPAAAALRSVGRAPVRFHALALAADGTPIPVLNSDEGFDFLFGRPSAADLSAALIALSRPFPAGLFTPVGVVVANPVFAVPAIQAKLSRSAYHGTVVWSWQQAVLAAGLERQLHRPDLGPALKGRLRLVQRQLWHAIHAADSMRNSELWSWSFTNHRFQIAPFGTNVADADEANPAQLWSTVYLAIADPVGSLPHLSKPPSRPGRSVAN
jgi:hypothetical protein